MACKPKNEIMRFVYVCANLSTFRRFMHQTKILFKFLWCERQIGGEKSVAAVKIRGKCLKGFIQQKRFCRCRMARFKCVSDVREYISAANIYRKITFQTIFLKRNFKKRENGACCYLLVFFYDKKNDSCLIIHIYIYMVDLESVRYLD